MRDRVCVTVVTRRAILLFDFLLILIFIARYMIVYILIIHHNIRTIYTKL